MVKQFTSCKNSQIKSVRIQKKYKNLIYNLYSNNSKEAHALALSEVAYLKMVKLNQIEESKVVSDKVTALLETVAGADPIVYSNHYKYLSLYYKVIL